MQSTSRRVELVAAVLVGFTGLVIAVPPVRFAYPLPGLALFMSTLMGVSAVVLSWLFWRRYQRSRRDSDAVLALAFGMSALLEVGMLWVREIDGDLATIALWSRLFCRLVIAALMCAAAWMPHRTTERPVSVIVLTASCLAMSSAVVLWIWSRQDVLPPAVLGAVALDTDAIVVRSQGAPWRIAGILFLMGAVVGFVRQTRLRDDALLGWLAVGTTVLVFGRVHDFFYPAAFSDWLTTGDVLRVVGQIMFVIGAVQTIVLAWKERVVSAALEERRRLARELHDGLAQEVAYLHAQSRLAARTKDEEKLKQLATAAERALRETRLAIIELNQDERSHLDELVEALAQVSADRHDLELELRLDPVECDERTTKELGRVAQEALANVTNHAAASQVIVQLRRFGDTIHLSVTDDGAGFEADHSTGPGKFGLTSMRERVEALGGTLLVMSTPGAGTTVVAEVPAT